MCARGSNPGLLRGPSTHPLEGIIVTSSFKLALVVSTTAVVAGLAGYLVARYQLSSLMTIALGSSYRVAAANAVLDVRTLRAIHSEDLAKATSILENQIDNDLIHLSFYNHALQPDLRDPRVYSDLAQVRTYRAEVPSTNPSPEVQAALTKALAQKPEAGGRK